MSQPPIGATVEGPGMLTIDSASHFGEFDLRGFDEEELAFLSADLCGLDTADIIRLCDEAFVELDQPVPARAARMNYEALSEELDRRQAE
ncbi:hypothetical protein GCM10027404_26170 [Arthrobacter tumbae]|uniref:hypothetical protein n=1 Tax=Arthrobacter tumbae TaxID=163874 RepID=UPI00195E7501|nr:hypothetical protein [Arthrobacter tumbae]MBM7781640.1 hypothetical protein [Arthrobacter tumbae]